MKIIRLVNLLSIDVAIGACASCFFIGQFLDIQVPFIIYALLFLAVLATYLTDHLVDQHKIRKTNISSRRLFYRENTKPLFIILFLVVFSGFCLAFLYLPFDLISRAGIIVFFVLCYLGFNFIFQTNFIPKEIVIAVLYVAGISFYPLCSQVNGFPVSTILLLVIYFVLALENLLIYSIVDYSEDKTLGFTSFPIRFGLNLCKHILNTCFILNFALLVGLLLANPSKWIYLLPLTVIHIAQILVCTYKTHLLINSTYRWIADGIFMLPFALLLTD